MDLDINIGKGNEIFSSKVQTDVAWTWSMEDDTSVLAGFLC